MLVIEVNEIHTVVSRSFVRPRATSPSLPACLPFFRVLLESVEHQGDENTPHPVYATAPAKKKKSARYKRASRRGPRSFL